MFYENSPTDTSSAPMCAPGLRSRARTRKKWRWNVVVTLSTIYNWHKNNAFRAEKSRAKADFLVDLSDIALTHRRNRIEGQRRDCERVLPPVRIAVVRLGSKLPAAFRRWRGPRSRWGQPRSRTFLSRICTRRGCRCTRPQELALAEWIRLPTERDQGGFQGPRYRAARARSYAMFKDASPAYGSQS